MNSKTLETLLIDRSFGELPPETEELLDAYLASHPAARAEADSVAAALSVTERAVCRRPDLFRETVASSDETVVAFPFSRWMQAAAALALLLLAATAGYFAGSRPVSVASGESQPAEAVLSSADASPWARYRLADSGPTGELALERAFPTPSPDQKP